MSNSGFNLYLPPDASPERRAAHDHYKAAAEAAFNVKTADAFETTKAALAAAQRDYGMVLLAEDKARRPHIYAKDSTMPVPIMLETMPLYQSVLDVLKRGGTHPAMAKAIMNLVQSQKESGLVP